MRVMLLSTDRLVFEEGSATRARMREYGGLFDELAVIVLSQREEREDFETFKRCKVERTFWRTADLSDGKTDETD